MTGRLSTVAVLTALWLAAIVGRLGQLQILEHAAYAERAEDQQHRVVELDAPRGTVYEARGRELAVSVEAESAWASPRQLAKHMAPAVAAGQLARLLRLDPRELAPKLAADRGFVWLRRKLDPDSARRLRDLALPGVYFELESKRHYPLGKLAGPVLGCVGTDNQGLAGLEQQYEQDIASKRGRRTVLRDALHGTLVHPQLADVDPAPGQDLYLTLDASIQHIAERELARAVEAAAARGGYALVLDPRTGAVLAMASHPGFDPNRCTAYPQETWRNRPVTDAFEPGSSFKMVTAAAALEANVLDPTDLLDCEMGGIAVGRTYIRDHKPFGVLSFRDVIARSSNVGAIKAALLVGRQRLYRTVVDFGFGQPTGIDLPGESRGILRPLDAWPKATEAYVGFGQGLSVSALQLAAAFAAVANGGERVQPYVVAAVGRDGERRPLAPRPVVLGRALSAASARQLERMLEAVVEEGTGQAAAIPGYRVAGKTGTAQKAVGGRGYASHVANFVGFAPARRPAVVCLVAIDEPRQGIEGGRAAAPAFAAIVRQVLLYLGVPPDREPPDRWPGEAATSARSVRRLTGAGSREDSGA